MSNVFTACPNCQQNFVYSSLLREPGASLSLHCRACDRECRLPNTEEQRRHLKNEYGEPSQIDQLLVINQLSVGDIISYRRKAWLLKYHHHAIVTAIDRRGGKVTVVEFAPQLPLKSGVIVRAEKDFKEDIETENAWIRRYMPLDCLPVDQVLRKANAFISNRESQPGYDITRCNCQHLSSWCKIGVMKSREASVARWLYHIAFHGIQIISVFACLSIVIGALVWTAVDTAVRVGRIWRTEFDLMDKEMKTPWQAVAGDILSLAATATFLAVASPAAGPVVAAAAGTVAAVALVKTVHR